MSPSEMSIAAVAPCSASHRASRKARNRSRESARVGTARLSSVESGDRRGRSAEAAGHVHAIADRGAARDSGANAAPNTVVVIESSPTVAEVAAANVRVRDVDRVADAVRELAEAIAPFGRNDDRDENSERAARPSRRDRSAPRRRRDSRSLVARATRPRSAASRRRCRRWRSAHRRAGSCTTAASSPIPIAREPHRSSIRRIASNSAPGPSGISWLMASAPTSGQLGEHRIAARPRVERPAVAQFVRRRRRARCPHASCTPDGTRSAARP